jgi:hypothetical protein
VTYDEMFEMPPAEAEVGSKVPGKEKFGIASPCLDEMGDQNLFKYPRGERHDKQDAEGSL